MKLMEGEGEGEGEEKMKELREIFKSARENNLGEVLKH